MTAHNTPTDEGQTPTLNAESVAASKRWYWDDEDQPRHIGCDGEVTFFHTLVGDETAMCLTCCELWEEERPDGQ